MLLWTSVPAVNLIQVNIQPLNFIDDLDGEYHGHRGRAGFKTPCFELTYKTKTSITQIITSSKLIKPIDGP